MAKCPLDKKVSLARIVYCGIRRQWEPWDELSFLLNNLLTLKTTRVQLLEEYCRLRGVQCAPGGP